MKLRAGSQGTGRSPGNGGAPKPCQPRQASVPGRDPPRLSIERNAALFWAARGTECCPFFSSSHPGRSPVSSRQIPGMASEHRKQLRAGAAAGSDVEMLHAEVRVVCVTEPHLPAECQPLARGVGDGVAEARAAQELGGREGLWAPSRPPHEPELRPQPHGLRLVRPGGTLRPVLQQLFRREPPLLPVIDGHPMGVRDDQAGVRQPAAWELLPGHLHGVPQRHLLGLVDSEVLQEAKDPLVAASLLRELVHAASRQVVQQLGLLQRPQHRGPAEGVLHRRPEQQKPDPAVRGELGDVSSCPATSAPRGWSSAPSGPPSRPQTKVLRAAVELRELRHDLPRQVRLARARHAGQQEAVAVEAVRHGSLHVAPGLLLRPRLRLQPLLQRYFGVPSRWRRLVSASTVCTNFRGSP